MDGLRGHGRKSRLRMGGWGDGLVWGHVGSKVCLVEMSGT